MPARKRTTAAERFERHVDRSTPSGCWLWTGTIGHGGYGQHSTGHRLDGTFKNSTAHRYALAERLGRPLLPGMQALHTCDTPSCVRNDVEGVYVLNGIERPCYGHLWEGTTQDNTADRVAKGRSAVGERNGDYLHPERLSRGEDRTFAKLTEGHVRAIRTRVANGERQVDLAAEYGVYYTTIGKVVRRESWTHVL